MNEMSKKRNPGILGYDPEKKKPTREAIQCPHCWFTAYGKSVLTKHINEEHWDKREVGDAS